LLHGAHRAVTLVGEVQLFAEAVQCFFEDLPRQRVEHRFEVAFAAPPGADRTVPAVAETVALGFARLGVDAVFPVVDDPHGVGEPRCAALGDEFGLIGGERRFAATGVGGGEHVDVVGR
jgi:hypothetical protein